MIPPDVIWAVVVGFIIAFVLAFGIGANDVANTFGTSVGAKVLTLRQACILATIFETLGSVLMGSKVSGTIQKGMFDTGDLENGTIFDDPNKNDTFDYQDRYKVMLFGHMSALASSGFWLIVATLLKLPVSGTHSIVGAVIGYAMVALGPANIRWHKLGSIVGSWFISPVLSGATTILMFFIVKVFILDKEDPLEPGLMFLPFIYAFTIVVNSFSVFYEGPSTLQFDKIPWWGAMIIALGLGLITGLLVFFVLVPWQRKKILAECSSAVDNPAMSVVSLEMVTSKDNIVDTTTMLTVTTLEDKPEQARLFSWLQVLTAIFGAFAHGGNDVSNAIGPLLGLWMIATTQNINDQSPPPMWLLLYGGVGISAGLWVLGRRVIETVGTDLSKITPSSGACIELGSALTVLLASNIGIPISTTHCKVGGVVCVGFFRSRENVNWKVFGSVALAWVVTLPITALISALIMFGLLKWQVPNYM